MSVTNENMEKTGIVEDTAQLSENQMEIDNCDLQLKSKRRKTDQGTLEDTNTSLALEEIATSIEKSGQFAPTPKNLSMTLSTTVIKTDLHTFPSPA
ncbi:8736_t:CDS:1, partial [Gigaspora rosea]